VLSSFAGNARKNDGLDALATALAASRNERLAAVDPEVGSEALCLLSERREDLVAERTRALKAASTGFCETPPRRGSRDALSPPSRGHLARHTAPGHLGPPQTAIGFGGAALRIRTLDRKIADLNGLFEAEVEASGTTLMRLQDRFRVTGYSNAHENSDLCTSVIRRGARKPPKGSALQRHFHHAPIADAPRQFQRRARPEDRLEPRMRLANGARRHPRLQREGPSRPPSEVLAPEEDPRRFRPEERPGVAGDAPPLSERVRIPEEPVDSCDGLRGGLRRGTHRRARLGETVRATLSRLLGVRWMRAKRWITSPDPLYERKKLASLATD
jgi:hypothetical protein